MTNAKDQSATEEAGSTPVPTSDGDAREKHETRRFLGLARRDLSEEELATPAARRFLIAEIERLDDHCLQLRSVEQSYNDLRVDHAQLTESKKTDRWIEILSFVSSSVGAAGIGAAPSYITAPNLAPVGWMFAILSAVLVVVGVIARLSR